MKLIWCNGKRMEIRDVGPILVEFYMINVPLKDNGYQLIDDETARQKICRIIDSNLYKRTV